MKGKQVVEKLVFANYFKKPIHPVIFCHGLFGFGVLKFPKIPFIEFRYWRGVEESLRKDGCKVSAYSVGPTASIKERAQKLNELLTENYSGQSVNLIGHSMVFAISINVS
jgi:triacylglycerol lipase